MRALVFDIETVPDVDLGKRLFNLDGLSDEDVGKAMGFHRLQETGSDFLPLHQHRIVAISVVWRYRDGLKVMTLGEPDSPERDLVAKFFEAIEKYTPDLVSWNGGAFDLPVLNYRALLHGIQAPRYWELGENETGFRYNNYLSRFHWRHLDLMDVLSGWQGRSRASLSDMATLLGFPGKLGFAGDQVWDAWLRGNIGAIRDYCETDVMNTYLIWLRFQFMRGQLDAAGLAEEMNRVQRFLEASGANHWKAFSAAWLTRSGGAESSPESSS
jgi:predicted PolB exonuclease-like 3'-5' exonuclease